jgi:hypothetical protein
MPVIMRREAKNFQGFPCMLARLLHKLASGSRRDEGFPLDRCWAQRPDGEWSRAFGMMDGTRCPSHVHGPNAVSNRPIRGPMWLSNWSHIDRTHKGMGPVSRNFQVGTVQRAPCPKRTRRPFYHRLSRVLSRKREIGRKGGRIGVVNCLTRQDF